MTSTALYNPAPIEKLIIECMAEGLSVSDMAFIYDYSSGTLETYRVRLYKKIRVRNAPQCVAWAFRNGVLKFCIRQRLNFHH